MRGCPDPRPRTKARAAEALLVAAAVLGAAAFFSACATPSRPISPKSAPKRPEPKAAERKPSLPPRRAQDYLKNCLSEFSSRDLPQGARLVVRRMRGRRVAAAEICLLGEASASGGAGGGADDRAEAGIEALGLSLAAAGAAGQKPGALSAELSAAGASLELRALGEDSLCLELVAPSEGFADCLAGLAAALARPAFAEGSGPSAGDFAAARRGLELAALRRESESPLGGSRGLLAIDAAKTVAHWKKQVRADRFLIVVVGDLEPDGLAAALAPLFASMPAARSEAPVSGEAAAGPDTQTSPAPRASIPERAALFLALSILEDSLQDGLSPEQARASSEAALARISEGSEELLRGEAFEAAKERALLRAYAEGDSAAALARRIALDLASGGDGLSYFRLGEGILAASPEDVSRAARESLSRASP